VKHQNEGARAHGFKPGRPPQFIMPARHDPYRADNKPKGEQVCPHCGLVNRRGRWLRAQGTPQAQSAACPACRRIADRLPAGILTVEGPFAFEKREDVLATARNVAEKVESEHPLERIMSIETFDGRLTVFRKARTSCGSTGPLEFNRITNDPYSETIFHGYQHFKNRPLHFA
jgi:hypothetical protein